MNPQPACKCCGAQTPPVRQSKRAMMTPPPAFVDVKECLDNVDELLLCMTPARAGRSYNIRFSTSPSPAPSPMPALALAQPADRDAGQVDLNMPVEVMLRMLQFLSPESLGALRRVCKSWRILINHHDRELFKPSCLERKWLVPIKPVDAANTGNAAIEDTGCLPGVLPVTPVRSSEGAGSPSGSERMVTPRGHWISVFASNYNCKKGFWNGKLADFCNSPYHDGKKLHMNFGVMDWGENLENALAAG